MQPLVCLIISVLLTAELNGVDAVHCNREPEDTHTPKSVGNHFQIRISGNPDKYVPGGIYTVNLRGQRIGRYQPTFTRFMLVVEPRHSYVSSWENSISGYRNVGSFTLVGSNIAKYSNHCPNAIIQVSSLRKTEINVTWTAPPPGSGCVVFRATVVEDREIWYKDDGPLSLILCEDVQKNETDHLDFDFPCCACDDALYEMTFEGLWSKPTHPKEFPPNEWLTGFTDLIGASHSSNYRFWEYGNFASEGLSLVAELGATHVLESEIMDKSEHIRTIIKARGLSYPNVTGKTYAVFRTDAQNHLVSVVSRIDPSPDWIVGVSGFNLCLENCSWVEYRKLNLFPWDAGTDSGITYMSPDMPTSPRQTVSRITSSYPNDPHSPFYDPSGSEIQPLARLYLRREQLFEKQCESNAEPHPVDCAMSEWSKWSICSVTCGIGKRYRRRTYSDKKRAHLMACNEILTEQDVCYAAETICSPPGSICAVTEWSAWSDCSVSCGIGEKKRTRYYKSDWAYERCSHHPNALELEQTIACPESEDVVCDREPKGNETDVCPDTEWSMWSPCSASCGKGKSIRKRIQAHKVEPENGDDVDCPEVHIVEEKDCTEFPSCEITPEMYREFCKAPKKEGACQGQKSRWFFDADTKTCQEFIYKGCNGNKNNYLTQEDCENTCNGYEGPEVPEVTDDNILDLNMTTYNLLTPTATTYTTEFETEPITVVEGPITDCAVSRWSRWSNCSVSCGHGYKTRSRSILIHPRNGGKDCPKRLFKRKRCGKKCGLRGSFQSQ